MWCDPDTPRHLLIVSPFHHQSGWSLNDYQLTLIDKVGSAGQTFAWSLCPVSGCVGLYNVLKCEGNKFGSVTPLQPPAPVIRFVGNHFIKLSSLMESQFSRLPPPLPPPSLQMRFRLGQIGLAARGLELQIRRLAQTLNQRLFKINWLLTSFPRIPVRGYLQNWIFPALVFSPCSLTLQSLLLIGRECREQARAGRHWLDVMKLIWLSTIARLQRLTDYKQLRAIILIEGSLNLEPSVA